MNNIYNEFIALPSIKMLKAYETPDSLKPYWLASYD